MSEATELPRPFYETPFRGAAREAAQALWAFHLALDRTAARGEPPSAYEAAAAGVLAGETPALLPAEVGRAAIEAAAAHDLPLERLADQVLQAGRLDGGIRFPDAAALAAFTDGWAGAHGQLLAYLGGARLMLQERLVRELARGFFLVGRLAYLPDDLAQDRLFIPEDVLAQSGVTLEDLRAGRHDAAMQRLLWKQAVRARDALAQGLPLVDDLPRREARGLRAHWLGALEVLRLLEAQGYDVWSKPVRLGPVSRLALRLQLVFGRRAGRTR